MASVVGCLAVAFLEPVLGDHALSQGFAQTPAEIGLLFSLSSLAYICACPVAGV